LFYSIELETAWNKNIDESREKGREWGIIRPRVVYDVTHVIVSSWNVEAAISNRSLVDRFGLRSEDAYILKNRRGIEERPTRHHGEERDRNVGVAA
jgi:hypothetical protein